MDLSEIITGIMMGDAQKKAIADSDPYLSLQNTSDSIGNIILQSASNPEYSLKDKLVTGLVSGLSSGFFKGLSQDYQGKTAETYQDILFKTIKGEKPEQPDGLSSLLFSGAKQQANLYNVQRELAAQEELKKIELAGKLAETTAKNTKKGELEAYGKDGANSAMNPLNQELTKLEQQARSDIKTAKIANDFTDIKASFDTMKQTYRLNDRAATSTFLESFARLNDPGSAVMEGQIVNAKNTQSYLDKMGYSLESLYKGTQDISPNDKLKMLRASAEKYNAFGGAYQGFVEKQRGVVKSANGDPSKVFGPVEYEPFNFVEWNKKKPAQLTLDQEIGGASATAPTGANTGTGGVEEIDGGQIVGALTRIRDELAKPNLDPRVRAELIGKAQELKALINSGKVN